MAHRSLHSAYEWVTTLEPLEPHASAAEEEEFIENFKLFRNYVGRMFEYVEGVGEASGVEVAELGELAAPRKDTAPADKRIQTIRDNTPDALGAQDLVAVITSTAPKTQQRQEDEAFSRLLCGYHVTCTSQELARLVYGDEQPHFDLSARTILVDNVLDVGERIFAREKEIAFNMPASTSSKYLHALTIMLNSIQFAKDWEAISLDPNARHYKSTYRTDAFNFYFPQDQLQTRKEFDKTFSLFLVRHEKVITARNTLYKMYQTFGAAVLLDPVWAPVADYTHGRSGRSSTFAKTANTLMENWSAPNGYLANNKTALIKLVTALGGDYNYIHTL